MNDVTRELLERLPKAELHVHLDGSLRAETMLELADEQGVPLPHAEPDALRDFMHVADAADLVGYLERFELSLAVMQTEAALERVAYELAQDAAAENVRYIEVRYSPALLTEEGLSLEAAVEAPIAGLRRAYDDFGIVSGIIICAIRSMSPETSLRLADLALDYQDRGVVGFDLAGAEAGFPSIEHADAFDRVAYGNLPATVHAGEAWGPDSIAQALHRCHARRIGHGTRLGEDRDLLDFVRDFRIPLEICPTSNVQTHATPSLDNHPLRVYYDHGVVVTLSTDNRLMSGVSLTDEYERVHQALRFDWEELVDITRMAFQSAFLPYPEKLALLAAVDDEIGRLNRE